MATDVEQLLVSLEANIKKYEREMARTVSVADRNMRAVELRTQQASQKLESILSGAASRMATGIGSVLAIGQISKFADSWTQAGNKIKSAGLGDAMAEIARNDVADIAQRSRTDFEATADLYARLTRAAKPLGKSQGEVAVATETVAKALKLAGASGAETESTLVQLGQALGSGRLQGDELRSLLENAPVLAGAIAKEFGVAVGQLKELGAEGKLTSDRVFDALTRAAPEINRAFVGTTATIAESFKVLETAAIRFVGQSGQMSAAGRAVGAVTQGLANNFNVVASGALALAAIIGSRVIAAGLTPLIAQIGAAVTAATAGTAAIGGLGAAGAAAAGGLSLAAVASRAAAGALALLGGVPGAIIFGLVSALAYFATKANEGNTAAQYYAAALEGVKGAADRANPSIRETAEAVAEANKKMFEAPVKAAQASYDSLARAIENSKLQLGGLADRVAAFSGVNIGAADKARLVELLTKALADDTKAASDAAAEIDRLGRVNPGFNLAFGQFAETLRYLGQIIVQAGKARAALSLAQVAADSNVQRSQAAADQDALFRSGVPRVDPTGDTTSGDPVLAQERLNQKVRIAQMDKNKRELQEKTKELYEAALASGGGVTLAQAEAAAKKILAAENAGGGGGSKNTPDKKFAKDILDIQQRTAALKQEQELLGKPPLLAETERAALELRNKAIKDKVALTADVEASIQREAEAYAKAKVSLDDARRAQEAYNQLQQFIGQNISSFFSDIVSGGKNASEALMNLTKRLADAAIQASLLGSGPLAALFGTQGVGGAPGGLIGMIFGGLKGAGSGGASTAGFHNLVHASTGGRVSGPGTGTSDSIIARVSNGEHITRAAMVKKYGPLLEAINTDQLPAFAGGGLVGRVNGMAGRVTAPPRPFGAGNISMRLTIDLAGANGDETIARIATRAAQRGAAAAIDAANRNFPARQSRLNLLGS